MEEKSTKAKQKKETVEQELKRRTMSLSNESVNYYKAEGATLRIVAPKNCTVEIISPTGCDISVSNADHCDVTAAMCDNISVHMIGVRDADLEMVDCDNVEHV